MPWQISQYYDGRSTTEISSHLPPGTVGDSEMSVLSKPISFHNGTRNVVIRGRLDAIMAFEDGSFGVIDYKTSKAKSEKAEFYRPQLAAYA